MDFQRVWLPFLYLYGAGGLLFLAGIWLTLKSDAWSKERRRDRRWMVILLAGFLWYALLHGAGIFAALSSAGTVGS